MLALLSAGFAGALESSAVAQEVNVFTDDPDGQGCTVTHCTLRERVDQAVTGDVVNLGSGTYQLTQGELALDTGISIAGRGARLTAIDAGRTSRIGFVTGTVAISGLTVTGGDASAGGSQPPAMGGAFYVDDPGVLSLTQTALVDNLAFAAGGAVANEGTFSFTGSLASGNRAEGNNPALGGAIWSIGQGTTVLNSTLSGNAAVGVGGSDTRGGGIYYADASRIEHATITGNAAEEGAGVHAIVGSGSISASVVAGNAGPQCGDAMATVTKRHNLSSDTTCLFDLQGLDARLGGLADNGGPTDTHALLAGSPAIDGVPAAFCPATDQRLAARPAGACDIGAFDTGFTPPPPPPPPEEGPAAGETVLVEPSGTVKVKRPGTNRFVRLREDELLPVGSVVDTLKGRVTLTATGGSAATFYDGIFRVTQGRGARPLTTLTLVERLRCGGRATAAAKAKKKRRLWGDGRGKFRVKGKHSAATVVGTKWLVEDTCTTTLTRVVRGRVSVRDFVKKKTVLVKAGRRYLARAKKQR